MSLFTFEQLQDCSANLKTCDIRGKAYVQVNERIKAFRNLIPDGTIKTSIVSMTDGMVVMKAEVYFGDLLLATGFAYEREGTTNINKTSFIENCETSAVGRALAFLGIGVDLSVASAEEVENAIEAQTTELCITKAMEDLIVKTAEMHGVEIEKVCERYKIKKLAELKANDFPKVMDALKKTKKE